LLVGGWGARSFLGSFWGEAVSRFGAFLGRGVIVFWGVFGERRDRFLGRFWVEAPSLGGEFLGRGSIVAWGMEFLGRSAIVR
jgi:hypothetical protein